MSEPTSQRNAAPGIVVHDVARSFGEVKAVRDVTLEAKAGEVTGLIGPNGSGKTTLLLMLASLLVPDRGTIRIGGHDPVTESREVRTVMGWMPDALGSWPTLTVRATLELTGRLYRFDRERAARRAAELIALVDLGDLADRPTRVLSRGQKQRLSLARALVHDPSVLLRDEPASGLDPVARVALRRLVRSLAA
ncbi:MAG: ABC transporter ATP-binding protein, partial [Leifsonia sp.]